jgi:tRNA(Ile)-lysidine synthase
MTVRISLSPTPRPTMSSFSPTAFLAALNASLPRAFGGKLCVALSGGVDSTVLLYALAALSESQPEWRLRAIHIDHQLQSASSQWGERCKRLAEQLRVSIHIEAVNVARDHVQGLEASAREARYGAFRQHLQQGEVLLTAHHADDQAETVLLALMRGSGVQGLAAMPACAPFACGWHVRPLLGFTRAALTEWAQTYGIASVEDPSNLDLRHDRNYLRHAVLPALRERWPSMATNIVRSTRHLGDALQLLDEQANRDLTVCGAGACLDVTALRALTPERRANVLRYWLRLRGLNAPSTRQLQGLERDMFGASDDRNPVTRWSGAEVHRYRGRLYAFAPLASMTDESSAWLRDSSFEMTDGALRFEITGPYEADQAPCLSMERLPEQLTVRYRGGGEHLRIAGRAHRKPLKKILQESGVLPWWRDRLPLLFAGKQLVAVGDIFIAAEFAATVGEPAARIAWDGRPEIFSDAAR